MVHKPGMQMGAIYPGIRSAKAEVFTSLVYDA